MKLRRNSLHHVLHQEAWEKLLVKAFCVFIRDIIYLRCSEEGQRPCVVAGASGCVIDPQTADNLGLQAFGELHVTGMGGTSQSRFRKATSLQLGAMHMQSPLFMEVPVIDLVKGAPGPVVGIIG
jgi:Aspartyl protease